MVTLQVIELVPVGRGEGVSWCLGRMGTGDGSLLWDNGKLSNIDLDRSPTAKCYFQLFVHFL